MYENMLMKIRIIIYYSDNYFWQRVFPPKKCHLMIQLAWLCFATTAGAVTAEELLSKP